MGPLKGVRVVVTRAAHQAEELAVPLRALGAIVIVAPVIGIGPPLDPEPLREAARNCNGFEWIIFTSANAVAAYAAELRSGAKECRAKIATVGAATRLAAERAGFRVALTPADYVAEALVAAFATEALNGGRILIPSAAVTREVVAAALRNRGAEVEVVEAYRNIVPADAAERASAAFEKPSPDWVTFASASAVESLVKLVGRDVLSQVKIATIGGITSTAARKHGLAVTAEAAVSTVAGLVEAVASFQSKSFQSKTSQNQSMNKES